MALFNRKQNKEFRNIIKAYYGDNFQYFCYNYANNIYSIPEVRKAIETYVNIFSIIPMYHKRVDKDENVTYFNDATTRIIAQKPNPLQNASQFWKSVIKRWLLESDIFIEPLFSNKDGQLIALYELPFKQHRFTIEQNRALVEFIDNSKNAGTKYDMNNLIYLNRFNSTSGGAKSKLGLYEYVLQSLGNQIVNVANPKKVRALLQGKLGGQGQLKPQDKKGTMKDIKANFDENVQGLAYIDSAWQVTPINWQENDVNREIMKMVINIVYNYFEISDRIVNYTASEVEFEQFITTSIKPLAKQVSDELTYKLFTPREIEFGNQIELDVFALSVSTLQGKTSLFSVATRQGILCIDECREYIGQPPLPNGLGKMYRVTGDTMNIELVDKMQSAQKGVEKKDTPNEPKNKNEKEVPVDEQE